MAKIEVFTVSDESLNQTLVLETIEDLKDYVENVTANMQVGEDINISILKIEMEEDVLKNLPEAD